MDDGWKPMHTAPKIPGICILVYRPARHRVCEAMWDPNDCSANPRPYWFTPGDTVWESRNSPPSDWRPMPPPPLPCGG